MVAAGSRQEMTLISAFMVAHRGVAIWRHTDTTRRDTTISMAIMAVPNPSGRFISSNLQFNNNVEICYANFPPHPTAWDGARLQQPSEEFLPNRYPAVMATMRSSV